MIRMNVFVDNSNDTIDDEHVECDPLVHIVYRVLFYHRLQATLKNENSC
jgi:hypothetical protein